jgi:YHS domain-containing protein
MDPVNVGHILIFLARLLEMFSFGIVLFFVFKGVALKHVFLTAGITVGGILVSIFGYLGNFLSPIASLSVDLFVFFVVLAIAFYALMEKREFKIKPPPQPPRGARCPVCGSFVKPEDDYCVAREGKDLLYFDSEEHLQSFLENFKEYKSLRKLNFLKIEDIYKKGDSTWSALKGLLLLLFFSFSCAEHTTVVIGDRAQPEPPGLVVASEKAVENGKKHLRKGNCGKAIKEFNKALDKNPSNFEALYWLGVAEGMCGYYRKAYDRFILSLKYVPGEGWKAKVYATIGITLLYMDREDEAIVYFERARLIDSKNEILIAYYEGDGKGHKKGRIKKKPKDREGFEITLRWMD